MILQVSVLVPVEEIASLSLKRRLIDKRAIHKRDIRPTFVNTRFFLYKRTIFSPERQFS